MSYNSSNQFSPGNMRGGYSQMLDRGAGDQYYSWQPDWLGNNANPGLLANLRYRHYMGQQGQDDKSKGPAGAGVGAASGSPNSRGALWWLDEAKDQRPDDAPELADFVRPDFQDWGGSQVGTPEGWQAPDVGIPEAGVNTRDIVDARKHYLDENMAGQMADAARLAGASGIMQSSDYVDSLGQAQRSRDKDLADLFYKYDYDAAQQDANRKSQARENMIDRDLSSWNTHGGWEQGASLANADMDYRAWDSQNSNALDMANAENQYNADAYRFGKQSYDDQQKIYMDLMNQLLRGDKSALMRFFGGGGQSGMQYGYSGGSTYPGWYGGGMMRPPGDPSGTQAYNPAGSSYV